MDEHKGLFHLSSPVTYLLTGVPHTLHIVSVFAVDELEDVESPKLYYF